MSVLSIALLSCAVLAVLGAEWPRLSRNIGLDAWRTHQRAKRKSQLRLLRSEDRHDEREDFAASVERDLSQLPTTEDRHRR